MTRFRMPGDFAVKCLAGIGAFAGVLSQADDLTDPRYYLAAIGTACGAVLALTRAPNTSSSQPRPPIGGQR